MLAENEFQLEDEAEITDQIDEKNPAKIWEDGQGWGRCGTIESFKEIPKAHYKILVNYIVFEELVNDIYERVVLT